MKTEQNLTEFNKRVERLRAVTGKTWTEIAAVLEVSRTMLHYYRNGQHPPDAPVLYRLAEAERHAGRPADDREAVRPAPGDGPHLRWLHDLLRQQQEVIAAAQRHGREIEGWIAEAERELARPPAAPAPAPAPARPAASRRKEKRAFLRRPAAGQTILRDIATVSLPVFGQLPAGWPQTRDGVAAQRPARTLAVARGRFPDGVFGLDVRGDSMNAARPQPILDGDTVVLLPPEQRPPRVGDIVAALLDGETCLKRLVRGSGKSEVGSRKSEGGSGKAEGGRRKAEGGRRKAEGYHLCSESTNPVHGELYPAHDLVIQGVVVGKL